MDESPANPSVPRRDASPVRLLTEFGPLLAFFVANYAWGIIPATKVLMAAMVPALAASWFLERRVPVMAVTTAAFVLIFGGLTIALEDELFIKLKPTIVNLCIACALAVGLALRRPFIKLLMGGAVNLTDEGWRLLTIRFIGLFVALAVLNEIVWRTFSTDTWVSFKVFGIMPLTIVFTMCQVPLINRHLIPEERA